jgi:hypothetical protein
MGWQMTVPLTVLQWQAWQNTAWQARPSLLLCLKSAHSLVVHDRFGITECSNHKPLRNLSGVNFDQNHGSSQDFKWMQQTPISLAV